MPLIEYTSRLFVAGCLDSIPRTRTEATGFIVAEPGARVGTNFDLKWTPKASEVDSGLGKSALRLPRMAEHGYLV